MNTTPANIELYDYCLTVEGKPKWSRNVLLYHHLGGTPRWMGARLVALLDEIKVSPDGSSWWHAEQVGAMLIEHSVGDDPIREDSPAFHPGLKLHGDIFHLWRIYLGPEAGEYRLECFDALVDSVEGAGTFKHLKPVAWEKEGA